jgi:ribonuclease P protein component
MSRLVSIKHDKVFATIARKGSVVMRDGLVLKFLKRHDEFSAGECAMAFVTSRKVGNAVERNLIKRRLRAIAREQVDYLPSNYYYLIICKPAMAKMSFRGISEDLCSALGTARRKITSGDETNRRPGQYRQRVRQYKA